MKKFLLLSFACGLLSSLLGQAAGQNSQSMGTPIYMPLDSIPNWVKAKVSPAEYELWKQLSHYYQVDYSVLQKDFSQERKKELYRAIRKTLADIGSGKLSCHQLYGYYTFFSLPVIDRDLSWEVCHLTKIDEDISLVNKQTPIYYARNEEKYPVTCSIWYIYDRSRQAATVLKYKFESVKDCSDFPNIMGSVVFLPNQGILRGSCAGTLDYVDRLGKSHVEYINVAFTCPLSF